MARAHRLSGIRGPRIPRRRGGLGQIDWGSVLTTGITTAGNVAARAVTPGPVPTYSYSQTPYGTQIQSYSPLGAAAVPSSLTSGGIGADFGSLLSSPITLLLLGLGLVLAFKK